MDHCLVGRTHSFNKSLLSIYCVPGPVPVPAYNSEHTDGFLEVSSGSSNQKGRSLAPGTLHRSLTPKIRVRLKFPNPRPVLWPSGSAASGHDTKDLGNQPQENEETQFLQSLIVSLEKKIIHGNAQRRITESQCEQGS